jgi:hypothetical protein
VTACALGRAYPTAAAELVLGRALDKAADGAGFYWKCPDLEGDTVGALAYYQKALSLMDALTL